ncbi:MAG TPA: hypothetical protein VHX38_22990 [Pseudonocardiaceae bacterium]|nr:hypothetical protein [Pseudonocardiaceae bacterium]
MTVLRIEIIEIRAADYRRIAGEGLRPIAAEEGTALLDAALSIDHPTIVAVTVGVGSVAGQVLGGPLLSVNVLGLGWRVIFLVNVPISLVAGFLALRLLPDNRSARRPRLDVVGAGGIATGAHRRCPGGGGTEPGRRRRGCVDHHSTIRQRGRRCRVRCGVLRRSRSGHFSGRLRSRRCGHHLAGLGLRGRDHRVGGIHPTPDQPTSKASDQADPPLRPDRETKPANVVTVVTSTLPQCAKSTSDSAEWG